MNLEAYYIKTRGPKSYLSLHRRVTDQCQSHLLGPFRQASDKIIMNNIRGVPIGKMSNSMTIGTIWLLFTITLSEV
jgi:hypothetical protein